MATLEELIIRVSADVGDVKNKLDELVTHSHTSANHISSSFGVATEAMREFGLVLSATALIEFTKESIKAGAELYTMSQNTGITVESLSALSKVAKDNGTDIDAVTQSIRFLQRQIGDAAQGNKQAIDTFAQLGVSAQSLAKDSPVDALLTVIDHINEFGSTSDRTSLSAQLLGRNIASLGGLASQSADGIRQAMEQAERLGNVISTEEAQRLDEFNRKWTLFVDQCQRLAQISFVGVFDLLDKTAGQIATLADPLAARNLDEVNLAIESLTARKDELTAQKADNAKGGFWESLFGDPKQLDANLAKVKDDLTFLEKMKAGLEAAKNSPQPDKTPAHGAKALRPAANPDINLVTDYIKKLEEQNDVLHHAKEEQAGLAAYYDILNQAKTKGIAITEEEKEKIISLGNANAQLAQQQREAQRAADEMRRSISDGLTNIAFNFKSAGDAANGFFKTIAENIFKAKIADPLSKAIVEGLGSSSIGSFFGFGSSSSSSGAMSDSSFTSFLDGLPIAGAKAGGGSVFPGSSYVVGERGREIFTPDVSGRIVANDNIGRGASITLVQNINVSPGVPELINASIRQSAPAIAKAGRDMVVSELQSGGMLAKLVRA